MIELLIILWPAGLASFAVSFATCLAIIAWFKARANPMRFFEAHANSVQAIHTKPTPRLGGISVALGFCASVVIAGSVLQAPTAIFWLPLVTAVPVFIVGLIEDLHGGIAARVRLIASAAAGGIFIAVSGQWIQGVDIFGFDWLLVASPIFAIAFTIFACAGATHAVNLIDGLNGLAGGFGVAASLCLALVAHNAGLEAHVVFLLILAASIAGFLILNFPFGKIFLGDAGAYTIGHALVWTAVSILALADDVSAFALLLIFFWPICDTCFAIARRLYAGQPIGMPDRGHFHHIVYAVVDSIAHRRAKPLAVNSTSALVIMPFMIIPMVAGVAAFDNSPLATIWTLGVSALYLVTYVVLHYLKL